MDSVISDTVIRQATSADAAQILKFIRALAEFERAVKLAPNHTGAYYQLGLLYRRKGEAEKAQEMFKIQDQINADLHKGIIYERMP